MIKIFKDKETEKVFRRRFSKKLPTSIQAIARVKLVMLDAAPDLNSLRVPPGTKSFVMTEKGSTVSELMINGEFVFVGMITTHMMLKL